jgi:hypothetical protein
MSVTLDKWLVADRWDSFVVISRSELNNLYLQNPFGSRNRNDMLSLYLSYAGVLVTCPEQDFSPFLNNWRAWPVVEHDPQSANVSHK